MDPPQLRDAFREFAGRDRFRKFVTQLRSDAPQESRFEHLPGLSRLRYWQEALWSEFLGAHPNACSDIELIRGALLWCDVHSCNLQAVATIAPHEADPPSVLDTAREHFPFGYGYWQLACPHCVEACCDWRRSVSEAKS